MKKNNPKVEFDEFVDDYRSKQDGHLWLTGESSEYFARYKVYKLATWITHLLNQNNNILDFGCGDGLMSYYLAYYFNNSTITGVDISETSINIAKKLYPKLTFLTIKTYLPFQDKSFDIICAAGVFHHIPFDQHAFWISELFRVLKPNGRLVLFELNPCNPGTQYIFRTHPMEKNAKMLWPWYTKNLVKSYGLAVNKYFCFFPGWLKILRDLESRLENWCLFGGLYATILHKSVE